MADAEIPQVVLQELEHGDGDAGVALESTDVADKELGEQALASNLDEAEGLENLAGLHTIPPRGAVAYVGLIPWEQGSGGPCRVIARW